jgi:hypothetical protein
MRSSLNIVSSNNLTVRVQLALHRPHGEVSARTTTRSKMYSISMSPANSRRSKNRNYRTNDLAKQVGKKTVTVRQFQDWQLHRVALVKAKAPGLWRELVEHVASEVTRLQTKRSTFGLEFDDYDGGNRFTLSNPAEHRSLTARFIPQAHTIWLEFRVPPPR